MSNPIDDLTGKVVTNDVPLPAPMPPTPAPNVAPTILPPEVNQGLMPPGGGEIPPPGEVPPHLGGMELEGGAPMVSLPADLPTFEAQKLQAPTITGNQQAIQIMGPGIQQEVMGMRRENANSMAEALEPVEPPRIWEAPDLDSSISRFGYNSQVLRESFKRQTQMRQDSSEREWLERNMRAIEAMAQPNNSPTANSMAWVNEVLGVSEEGGRTYTRPVVWNQSKGEWQGSPVGGVLYAFGILQNSAVGAFMDIANMAQNVDRGIKQAFETFTPPWLRHSTAAALSRLEPFVNTKSISNVKVPSIGKYNDGKSNFVEALRGAQFSFSDKSDKGFGLNYDKGFRLSTDLKDYTGGGGGKRDAFAPNAGPKWLNNKSSSGIDINPGVLVGVALDVVLGGKVDKLAGALATKHLPRRLRPGQSILSKTPSTPTAASAPARAAQSLELSVPVQPRQLEIPFVTGPVPSKKPFKVPLPANLKALKVRKPAAPPKTDVQQVLPIRQMMQEFGEADRATNPKAYMPGYNPDSIGQLSLRLEGVKSTPLPPPPARIKPPSRKIGGKQLKLDFDALPEAVPPRPSILSDTQVELLRVADDAPLESLPPSVRGKVLNKLQFDTHTRLNEIEVRMSVEPDNGRRFAPPPPRMFTPYSSRMKLLDIYPNRVDLEGVDLYHGTKFHVPSLDRIDPAEGAAFSELGTGIYLSPERGIAELASQAQPSAGLPSVEGRNLINGPYGDIHEVGIAGDANIINGAAVIPGLDELAAAVAQDFPALKGVNFRGKSLVQIYDTASLAESSGAAKLQFQQQMAKALREEMIDGVKVGENIAVYNQDVILNYTRTEVPHPTGVDPFESRAALEDWGASQVDSSIAQSNALDTEALAASMRLVELDRGKREAINEVFKDIEYRGLMNHPSRVPTLDEFSRITVDTLFGADARVNRSEVLASNTDAAIQPLFDKALEVARNRGLSVDTMANLPPNTGGNYNTLTTNININRLQADKNLSRFETLIHEMAHHEITKLVPYVQKDALLNEAIVDSVGATVASILAPQHSAVSKTGFDSFFQYLNSTNGSYAQHGMGATITKNETLTKYGELISRIAQDMITDIKGPDFKPPNLSQLNIFGPAAYDNFVVNYHKGRKTLAEAVDNHIVELVPDLSPDLQIMGLATNPVTGKINREVYNSLQLQFADEVPTVVTKPNTILEKWATSLSRHNNPFHANRKTEALKILDEIQRGGTDYETYLSRLSKLDKDGAKQYSPVIRKQIDEYNRVVYCS